MIWLSLRALVELERGCSCCCRIGLRAKGSATHPRLRVKVLEPVFHRRNPTQIIGHMLLADGAHGNGFPFTVLDGRSKNGRAQKNPLAVMPKRAVPKIGEMGLALVKPIMDRQIVLRFAAKQPR